MSVLLFQPHPVLSEQPPRYDPTEHCPFICEREARTLGGLLVTRVLRTPDQLAYRYFDENARGDAWCGLTWSQIARRAGHWQRALLADGLRPGDRVAIMLPNGPDWVAMDMAALGLGLIVVPLFLNDRPDNAAYCIAHSGARLVILPDPVRWHELAAAQALPEVRRVVTLVGAHRADSDARVVDLEAWLDAPGPIEDERYEVLEKDPEAVATLCYTSGTTGHPKGVTLTHRNLLWNAEAGLRAVRAGEDDRFLSFLPLSHMLERTAGYYIPMMCGATVSFARSVADLADDLRHERPTVLIAVPRVFERIETRIQEGLATQPAWRRALFRAAVAIGWERFRARMGRAAWCPRQWLDAPLQALVGARVRAQLGGHLRFAIVGGAPLAGHTARLFIGLGVPLLQGYGLTEAGPVVSVNRLDDNDPASVGAPLHEVEVRVGPDNELQVRSPGVMRGYWRQAEATAEVLDTDGWLHTGDQVAIRDGRLDITGRLKDVLVLSTGEKVSPADMEAAIVRDPWIAQALVIGDNRPCLGALLVLSEAGRGADHVTLLGRVNAALKRFPGYARVHALATAEEPWSVDNGLMTPTLKLRRHAVLTHYAATIAALDCRRG